MYITIETKKFEDVFPDEDEFIEQWKKFTTDKFKYEFLQDDPTNTKYQILIFDEELMIPKTSPSSINVVLTEPLQQFKFIQLHFRYKSYIKIVLVSTSELLESTPSTSYDSMMIKGPDESDHLEIINFNAEKDYFTGSYTGYKITNPTYTLYSSYISKIFGIDKIEDTSDISKIAKEAFKILQNNFNDNSISKQDEEKWKALFFTKLNSIWPAYYHFFNLQYSNISLEQKLGKFTKLGKFNATKSGIGQTPEYFDSFSFAEMSVNEKQKYLKETLSTKQDEFINELSIFVQENLY